LPWITNVIVSTDDVVVEEKTLSRGYTLHKRPNHLAGPAVSIKSVVVEMVEKMSFDGNEIMWLFYLPILYKNRDDFDDARRIIEQGKFGSMCTFVKARAHPFNCWQYDIEAQELKQYISNNVFRRQDLPAAWMHYHYVCCFKIRQLIELNDELLCNYTYPIFLPTSTSEQLIEIDTPEDYEKWKILTKCDHDD
jgi:CMP-N-acetylneuraminic acid synthetase